MKKWTVKPYYTPREDSDPLGVFLIQEVADEASRLEDESFDAAPNSPEEQVAIDARDKVQEESRTLIAAAPELLSALEEMMSVFQDHEQYDEESAEVVSMARAAIAKAYIR